MNKTTLWIYIKLLGARCTLAWHREIVQYLSKAGYPISMADVPEDVFLARYYIGPKV